MQVTDQLDCQCVALLAELQLRLVFNSTTAALMAQLAYAPQMRQATACLRSSNEQLTCYSVPLHSENTLEKVPEHCYYHCLYKYCC
jgi:hypothetical protein